MSRVLFLSLLILTSCAYRTEKVAGTTPGLTGPTDPGAPSPTPQAPQEWFTALSESIFKPKCNGCHNPGNPKGDVILTSYQALMSTEPAIIVPFKPKASKLLKSVESGEMPKKAPPLSEVECNAIKNWIMKGAPEKNPDAPLDESLVEEAEF